MLTKVRSNNNKIANYIEMEERDEISIKKYTIIYKCVINIYLVIWHLVHVYYFLNVVHLSYIQTHILF